MKAEVKTEPCTKPTLRQRALNMDCVKAVLDTDLSRSTRLGGAALSKTQLSGSEREGMAGRAAGGRRWRA